MNQYVHDALCFALWHHQGGSSPIGQPIRKMLDIGEHDDMDEDQLKGAKRVQSALANATLPALEPVGEALRIADLLERDPSEWGGLSLGWKAAAELRRLQTLNQELLEALKELLRCPSGEYDTTDDYENACKKAEAAIAKAGETK